MDTFCIVIAGSLASLGRKTSKRQTQGSSGGTLQTHLMSTFSGESRVPMTPIASFSISCVLIHSLNALHHVVISAGLRSPRGNAHPSRSGPRSPCLYALKLVSIGPSVEKALSSPLHLRALPSVQEFRSMGQPRRPAYSKTADQRRARSLLEYQVVGRALSLPICSNALLWVRAVLLSI